MDMNSLKKFRSLLMAEKNRIIANSKQTLQNDLNVSTDDLPDEADLAASEINQSLVFELRNRERSILSKINVALQKMEEGTFGECDSCGETIGKKRLEARPFSILCVLCQEQTEHREKVYA